ncbi:IS3 family transposase [Paraburkholderia hospita]|uniref:IS3 family transposase n=1 Tax=Paraburkholderia hospita TaxID=169430 RepID=UPI001054D142
MHLENQLGDVYTHCHTVHRGSPIAGKCVHFPSWALRCRWPVRIHLLHLLSRFRVGRVHFILTRQPGSRGRRDPFHRRAIRIRESEPGPLAHCDDGTAARRLDKRLLPVAGARARDAHTSDAQLLAREGVHVGRKRVARLMRMAGLCEASRRRWPRTTRPRAGARRPPDLVRRHFGADATNVLCVANATYVPTGEGFLYLAAVLDDFILPPSAHQPCRLCANYNFKRTPVRIAMRYRRDLILLRAIASKAVSGQACRGATHGKRARSQTESPALRSARSRMDAPFPSSGPHRYAPGACCI